MDVTGFKPIRQSRASEEVLAQLREAILRGQFSPGDKLPSERELTEMFQVSRGVVREAIRALEITGFVGIRHGPAGGAFITGLTFDRLVSGFLDLYLANRLSGQNVMQVRLIMEPEAARIAATNVNDEYRDRILDAIREEAVPATSQRERRERLTKVHYVLAEMSGNYLLEAITTSMIRLTHEIIGAVDPLDHDLLHPVGEHDQVVEAVLRGDPDGAAQAMAAHLRKFADAIHRMDDAYRHRVAPTT